MRSSRSNRSRGRFTTKRKFKRSKPLKNKALKRTVSDFGTFVKRRRPYRNAEAQIKGEYEFPTAGVIALGNNNMATLEVKLSNVRNSVKRFLNDSTTPFAFALHGVSFSCPSADVQIDFTDRFSTFAFNTQTRVEHVTAGTVMDPGAVNYFWPSHERPKISDVAPTVDTNLVDVQVTGLFPGSKDTGTITSAFQFKLLYFGYLLVASAQTAQVTLVVDRYGKLVSAQSLEPSIPRASHSRRSDTPDSFTVLRDVDQMSLCERDVANRDRDDSRVSNVRRDRR